MMNMPIFTIVAYVVPEGKHHVEESIGADAAEAAIRLRDRLGWKKEEFEIVAIAPGKDPFVNYDYRDLALAPFTANSP